MLSPPGRASPRIEITDEDVTMCIALEMFIEAADAKVVFSSKFARTGEQSKLFRRWGTLQTVRRKDGTYLSYADWRQVKAAWEKKHG